MIQLITWNVPYLLKEELLRWKYWFTKKQSELGISHIQNLWDSEKQTIRDVILSRSFLSAKKLLILEDIDITDDFIPELCAILQKKDEDTIVLISLSHVDKRLSSYKNILKIASEHTDYTFLKSQDWLAYLQKKYWKYFELWALQYLFDMKGGDISKTLWEIQKLLVSRDTIDKKYIDSCIVPELESSIFILLDAYLYKQTSKFYSELTTILDGENFYLISQWLLSNLRNHLYIEQLKSDWKIPKDIAEILSLWNKSFLVSKTYKRSSSSLMSLYKKLIHFDSQMKQWKLWSFWDDDIKKMYRAIFLHDFT